MGKFTTLEKSALTKDWAIDERSALAHFLVEKKLAETESLFGPRATDRGLYFFDSGNLRMSFENQNLELHEGDSFGELSLIHANQKTNTLTAQKESILWMLSLENYLNLKKVAPIVSLKLVEAIAQKMAKLLNSMVPPPKLFQSSTAALNSNPLNA